MVTGDAPRELHPLREVTAALEARGYTAGMRFVPGPAVRCDACDADLDPRGVTIVGLHRHEGASDPSDEEVVLALHCPAGHRGTIITAYGPAASAEAADALVLMPDTRDRG